MARSTRSETAARVVPRPPGDDVHPGEQRAARDAAVDAVGQAQLALRDEVREVVCDPPLAVEAGQLDDHPVVAMDVRAVATALEAVEDDVHADQ